MADTTNSFLKRDSKQNCGMFERERGVSPTRGKSVFLDDANDNNNKGDDKEAGMRYADGTQEQETFRHGVETTFFASGHKQGEGLSSLPEFHNQSHADATCDNSDEATETGNVTLGCGKQNTSIQVDRTRNFEQSRDAIDESTDEQGEVTPLVHDAGEGIGGETGERPSRRRRRLLKFNIGGTIFQTEEETVFDTDTTGVRLADRDFVNGLYDPDLDEYFLDRDPEVFRSILNFLRSGKLHIPSTMCGPQVKEELAYWGVSEIHIEPCCWHTFNSWNSTMDSLKQLERDSKLGTLTNRDEQPMTCRRRVWRTLTDPSHSRLAKIYGWVALLFVMAAIFSFVVSTHSAFRVPLPQGRSRPQPPHYHLLLNNSSSISSPSPDNVTTPAPSTTAKAGSVSDFLEETEAHPALWYLDIVCLIFFSVEYVLKVTCAPKKCKFVTSFNGVVDVLAVSPDYVEFIVAALDPEQINSGQFMLFIPFLRLMRAFRIFRLIRHVPGLWIMVYTLKASYKDLSLMLIFLLVGTLLFASVIFFVDDKDTFTSIPHSFWWAIVTMTTVGYGDMYPVTWPGYVIGSVTAVCGVLIIGFTIPALVNNFILYYQHVQFAIQKEKLRKQLGEGEKEGDVEKDTPKRAEKREKGDQAENIPLVRMN